MRHRLGEARYRIGLAVAVAAMLGLAGLCWWLVPILAEGPAGIRIAAMIVIAVLFTLVILLIWLLHWDHGRD